MRFEGDMEIKRFIDVHFRILYVPCVGHFPRLISRDGSVFKVIIRSASKGEGESPDIRASPQLSRGLFSKSASTFIQHCFELP